MIFIALSILPIREAIVNAIPMGVKSVIGAGIGLFIAFIGLQTAEIVVGDPATLVALGDLSFQDISSSFDWLDTNRCNLCPGS